MDNNKHIEGNEHLKLNNEDKFSACLDRFLKDGASNSVLPTPTGFKSLDDILDGGLYEGLYVIGGVTALGKTTFVLQIADQIAKSGRDILICSLEMADIELVAKSVSRETFLYCRKNNLKTDNAKTTREFMRLDKYDSYSAGAKEALKESINACRDFGQHIVCKEGSGDIGVLQIKDYVNQYKELTGRCPIVIIDYLQILAPYYERGTDKQNIDKAVTELKKISRDFKTTVIAISAFNRDSYSSCVSLSAFKESGAIEYSSDVLIALQVKGMKEGTTERDRADNRERVSSCMKNNIRDIEAIVLKNRHGSANSNALFKYYAAYNTFEEVRFK